MIAEMFAHVNYPIDGLPPGPMLICRRLKSKVIRHIQAEFIGPIEAVYCIALSLVYEHKLITVLEAAFILANNKISIGSGID
jgi:hypothetical protein